MLLNEDDIIKLTYIGDVDVIEKEGRDSDVCGDDEEDEDEDAEEPALLDNYRICWGRFDASSATFWHFRSLWKALK